MPEDALLRLAFAMGQAIPGGRLALGEPRGEPAPALPGWDLPAEETQEDALQPDQTGASIDELPTLDTLPTEPAPAEPPVADAAAATPQAAPASADPPEREPAREAASTELVPASPTTPAPEYVEDADTLVPDDPWRLWDEGDEDTAEAAFAAHELDARGRARVRSMLQSTDPQQVAHGCRIARLVGWRTAATSLRRLLSHADTRVREEAVKAIGDLAGPALVPSVRLLINDASPEVRAAAVSALMKLENG